MFCLSFTFVGVGNKTPNEEGKGSLRISVSIIHYGFSLLKIIRMQLNIIHNTHFVIDD